jgi:hypothetical protein
MYFDACLEWHERLSPDQQETCRTLADVVGSRRLRGTHCNNFLMIFGSECAWIPGSLDA